MSKLDLNKSFYQIRMKDSDVEKTAFCSSWGKFAFTRMFGLRNAPATFQRHMDEVLSGSESFAGAYIDDVVIFSKDWPEHLQHLRETLTRLRGNGLTAKPSKCVWGAAEITYLGHTVSKGRLSVPECRVTVLREFKRPLTKTDLRAFLGVLLTLCQGLWCSPTD